MNYWNSWHRLKCACFSLVVLSSCQENTSSVYTSDGRPEQEQSTTALDSVPQTPIGSLGASFPDSIHGNPLLPELEQTLRDQGLVNVQELDPSIRVSLAYSTTDNFLKTDVYGDLARCYLQPEVARMLVKASSCIQMKDSAFRLIVFDGVRPLSVQRKMWDIVKGTQQQQYVAAPTGGGGMHNYGCAVDLGLYHVDSGVVDMGTPFDFFGELAQPRYEVKFVQEGKLTQEHLDHRRALRACMIQAGFSGILNEWWHFNAFPKEIVRHNYTIIQ